MEVSKIKYYVRLLSKTKIRHYLKIFYLWGRIGAYVIMFVNERDDVITD